MERKNANKSIEINRKKYNIKNRKGETVAYTIISQNNTTTTLSDENGNVITVPARVTLATSTDYTIIKVNNNSVDLESGDGKIIRGVPACVVLAGEGGGGGSSYTAGTGIDITSGVISVAAPTLVNSATASGNLVIGNLATDNGCSGATVLGNSASVVDRFSGGSVVIGSGSSASGGNNIAVGENAHSTGANSIAIGYASTASASRAIQFGSGGTNTDANTFKVANANGNFEIMSADGTIPAARHASLPATDGTYVLKLVIASGVPTLSWVAE